MAISISRYFGTRGIVSGSAVSERVDTSVPSYLYRYDMQLNLICGEPLWLSYIFAQSRMEEVTHLRSVETSTSRVCVAAK